VLLEGVKEFVEDLVLGLLAHFDVRVLGCVKTALDVVQLDVAVGVLV
jgi:hypothetical protein